MFLNNKANKGSTIGIELSTISFHGFTKFNSNSCKNKGGAMNIINSNLSLTDQILIFANNAKDGGAIQTDHSALQLQGWIEIINNSATQSFIKQKFGGAINSIESNVTMEGRVTLSNNHIVTGFSMSLGRSISLRKSFLSMSGIIDFNNNYAAGIFSYGGAILLSNSTVFAKSIYLSLRNNSANIGGAIALSNLVTADVKEQLNTLVLQGDSLLDSNNARISAELCTGMVLLTYSSMETQHLLEIGQGI